MTINEEMNGYYFFSIILLNVHLGKWLKELGELTVSIEKSWVATL